MLTLSLRDRDRISLLRQVREGVLGATEAAERMGITPRHFRRLRKRWEEQGDAAVMHRSRGRLSNRRLPESLRERALEMARDPLYEDFAPTLLSEHLERDTRGGPVHPTTLRLWLIQEGLWEVRARRRRHRSRRPRRPARGELVLMDSSEHDWLEGRSTDDLSLVAMIDDATSELFACFFPRDTGLANRLVLTRYLHAHGRMGALYVDRAGHFGNWRSPHGSRKAGDDPDPMITDSIIRQGLRALEIELIFALSPQAKGRVERLFGTLQDRLIKEMRVARVGSLEHANQFLQETFIPFWNRRFTVNPAKAIDAHRELPHGIDLNALFAETQTRVLREDFTFRYRNQFWQITAPEARDLRPKQRITIEHRLDGSTHYRARNQYLNPSLFVAPPPAPPPARKPRAAPPRPAASHPWRQTLFLPKQALTLT